MAGQSSTATVVTQPEIKALLEKPFGPYLDDLLLTDKCKSTKTSVLGLEELMLECDRRMTGLDQTEHTPRGTTPLNVRGRPPLPKNAQVRFRGVLTINTLAHLTETGLKYLNEDFTERQTQAQIKGDLRRAFVGKSIKDLYAANGKGKPGGYRIQVWIQGYKNMSAGYMTSKLVPNGLMLTTRDQNRNYEVLSFHIESYMLSRTYLLRYHTFRALQEIVDLDRGHTPLALRTPEWFVERYMDDFAYPARSRWRRIYYNHNASSSEEASDINEKPSQECIDARAGHLTHRPRHPRHVHRAEIRSVFASHVEWIVEEHKIRQRKFLNVESWSAWVHQVEVSRARARRADPQSQWGRRDEYKVEQEDEEQEDEDEDGVAADSEADVVVLQSPSASVGRAQTVPDSDEEPPPPPARTVKKTSKRKAKKVVAPVAVYPLVPADRGKGKGRGRGRGAIEAVAPAVRLSPSLSDTGPRPRGKGEGARGKGKTVSPPPSLRTPDLMMISSPLARRPTYLWMRMT
ncbi:hypothetical protein FA95DRAFT_1509915, partial [Auriscalpium vulgare]